MDLARGRALVHGRDHVDWSDLTLIGATAISSVPGHLRPILRKLREVEQVATKMAASLCRRSDTTARKYLIELSLLGICDVKGGGPITNEPTTAELSLKYRWLKYKP
jgi:hypothetical protein